MEEKWSKKEGKYPKKECLCLKTEEICPKRHFFVTDVTDVTDLFSMGVFLEGLKI